MRAKGVGWTGEGPSRSAARAEPGLARREPRLRLRAAGVKEGAHGGTTGSPVPKPAEPDPGHAGEGSWMDRRRTEQERCKGGAGLGPAGAQIAIARGRCEGGGPRGNDGFPRAETRRT